MNVPENDGWDWAWDTEAIGGGGWGVTAGRGKTGEGFICIGCVDGEGDGELNTDGDTGTVAAAVTTVPGDVAWGGGKSANGNARLAARLPSTSVNASKTSRARFVGKFLSFLSDLSIVQYDGQSVPVPAADMVAAERDS